MNGQEFLAHHGIKGQQWGKRRFQNEDGSLTAEGKSRYYDSLTDKQKKQYDAVAPILQRGIERRMAKGKSFTKAYSEMNKAAQIKALGISFIGIPLLGGLFGAGTVAATIGAQKGLGILARKVVNSNTFERVKQHASQFMKRYSAKKAGAITLGKKDYSVVSGEVSKKAYGLIKI